MTATDRTEHVLAVAWSNGYRATCSCGKYSSKRYPVLAVHAKRGWEAHVRSVTGNWPRHDGGRFAGVSRG